MKLNIYSSDRRIVERIRKNDRTVLGELFIEYERLVIDQVRRLGGNTTAAEDLLQEAIIVLWQNVISGRFEVTSKISTYIAAVVKNRYLSEQRKKGSTRPLSTEINPKDPDPSPLDLFLDQEKNRLIDEAMHKLNEVCRKILIMFYFEKRALADIALSLNFANEQVAKSKKYQCKKALKDILNRTSAFREDS